MTWVADKLIITNIITASPYSYKEVGGNKDLISEQPSTANHKGFTFKPLRPEVNFLTDSHNISSNVGELTVSYTSPQVSDYDSNYDLWIALLSAIRGKHYGFIDLEYSRHPQNAGFSYGRAKLNVGVISA